VYHDLRLPRLGVYSRQPSTEIPAPAKQISPHHWKFRDLHMAFKLPYIYDYITKLCRQQGEVIQNHENAIIRNIGRGEPRHRLYKRHKLCGGQTYGRSSD
jgi:hypothetical protein